MTDEDRLRDIWTDGRSSEAARAFRGEVGVRHVRWDNVDSGPEGLAHDVVVHIRAADFSQYVAECCAEAETVCSTCGASENEAPDYEDLVERVLMNVGRSARPAHELWVHVKNAFAVGSTRARDLCRRFGLDPDEKRGAST